MHHMIIVGGGPAAMAAAVYGLDKQLDIRVIAEELGGQVGVPREAGEQLAVAARVSEESTRLFEHAVHNHPDLVLRDRVVDVEKAGDSFRVTTQRHGMHESLTVIVATGVRPIPLDVPGARQWLGYGLGYSPTTYARLLAGKHVAVIGGTLRALRGAAELARTAAQVYLILPDSHRETSPLLAQLRQRPNVAILAGYRITELLGRERVEQVAIARADEQAYLSAEAVFADLGLLPHSEMVRRIAAVDADGFIVVDERHATTIPGLFAAGDVTTAFSEQIVIALGDGTRAAVSAYDYLLAQPAVPGSVGQH